MSKQVGFIAVAVMASITLVILAFKEVDEGHKWHQKGLAAAKHLSLDNAHLVPLLYTPGVEPRTIEHGDNYTVGDEGGAPIDQWLSGLGGANQAAAALRDAGLEKKPVAMVHLPERSEGPVIIAPERNVWKALDFEKEEAEQQRRAQQAAAALERESAWKEPPANGNRRNGAVEVKKLMTAKSFAKWKRCMDYYSSGKVTADMMQVIENGDLKQAPQQVAQALRGLTKQGCVFFTQNCLRPSRPELVSQKQTKTFTPKEYNRLPPALPRNALGSCAIVGHSDRLLGQSRGFEIDAHTTVIRIGFFLQKQRSPPVQLPSGPPVAGFEMHVGYKTDFVFLPTGRVYSSPRLPHNTNTTMWQTEAWQVITQSGKSPIRQMAGRGKYQPLITGVRDHVYHFFKNSKLASKPRYASDELTAILWWLSSGLCKTIDVYGMAFPQYGETQSRAYWSTAAYDAGGGTEPWPGPSMPAQNAALEMYAMHAAMRDGLLCVHTH